MARLPDGEKEGNASRLMRVLRAHQFGLREGEVAEMLGWQRRTANNYLRELQAQGNAYRECCLWYLEG